MLALSLFFILSVVVFWMVVIITSVRIALFKYRAPNPLPAKQYNDAKLLAAIASLEAVVAALPQAIALEIAKVSPPSPTVPVQSSVQYYFEQSDTGRNKLSPKLMGAIKWISEHDPHGKLSVRRVAAGARVSIGTAQAAIKIVQDEKVGKLNGTDEQIQSANDD